MTDETAPEGQEPLEEREVAPWWYLGDTVIGVGFRGYVLAQSNLQLDLTPAQYEAQIVRNAYWMLTGEWPAPPEPPGKPRHLRPV